MVLAAESSQTRFSAEPDLVQHSLLLDAWGSKAWVSEVSLTARKEQLSRRAGKAQQRGLCSGSRVSPGLGKPAELLAWMCLRTASLYMPVFELDWTPLGQRLGLRPSCCTEQPCMKPQEQGHWRDIPGFRTLYL